MKVFFFFAHNFLHWEYLLQGSSLSTIFGILKKSYYAKFVLVSTKYPISTSTNFTKGELISKANCQAMDSSKKRTNEFVFTTMQHVFVRFLEESMA